MKLEQKTTGVFECFLGTFSFIHPLSTNSVEELLALLGYWSPLSRYLKIKLTEIRHRAVVYYNIICDSFNNPAFYHEQPCGNTATRSQI